MCIFNLLEHNIPLIIIFYINSGLLITTLCFSEFAALAVCLETSYRRLISLILVLHFKRAHPNHGFSSAFLSVLKKGK